MNALDAVSWCRSTLLNHKEEEKESILGVPRLEKDWSKCSWLKFQCNCQCNEVRKMPTLRLQRHSKRQDFPVNGNLRASYSKYRVDFLEVIPILKLTVFGVKRIRFDFWKFERNAKKISVLISLLILSTFYS